MFRSLLLIGFVLATLGGTPIPAEQSISAHLVRTLAVPSSQPTMHMPTAVAIDSHGTVFVADGANNRIVRFDSTGEVLPPFAPDVKQPTGVFVDIADRLWIADSGHHRVLRLDATGNIAEAIDIPADHDKPAKPTDVLLLPDNSRLYVVDNDNHRLMVRDQRSGTWSIIGRSGTALGQFQYPFMFARGRDNDIVITEAIGGRAQILAANDRWVGQVSEWGIELGQLYRPKGIAVDRAGRIYISDSTLQVVQVFNAQGVFVGILTDDEHQPIRFEHPMGINFDSAGRLYVVELKADRVAVLELLHQQGETP